MTDFAAPDFSLQLRWADLDTLNHVNNVRYIDYALEATGQLIADGHVPANADLTRIAIEFLRPLTLSLKPIRISSVVNDHQIVQEIWVEDLVYAKITTDVGSLTKRFAAPHEGPVYPAQIRRNDLDGNGQVTSAKVFELFQESRILHFARLLERHAAGNFVVGKLIVDFHQPITWQPQPLTISSWIASVGNSSMVIDSRIAEGDDVYATCQAVLVGFDMVTQKSRKLSESEKEQLSAGL